MAATAVILDFRTERFLAIFDLQVTRMLPAKFQVNWPFVSGEEAKIYFHDGHHGRHLGFPTGTILSICDLQATAIASFQVSSQLAF